MRRLRRNATDFYERQRPSEYARRLVTSHGLKKAEDVTTRGASKYGKGHSGWWTAAYDTTQTIKHSGRYAKNPRSKKAKFYHKKLKAAHAFARKSFRTIRIGKHGKLMRVGCAKGKYKRGRCSVGMRAQGLLTPKYVGIARASKKPKRKK